MPRSKPNHIDRYIGLRLRQRRKDYALSLNDAGAALGVSGGHLGQYERGQCKISASRLCKFAYQWQVPVSYFLPDWSAQT